jgi:hypothetical protein
MSVALKIWLQVSDASVAWSINLLEEERRLSSGLVSATLSIKWIKQGAILPFSSLGIWWTLCDQWIGGLHG